MTLMREESSYFLIYVELVSRLEFGMLPLDHDGGEEIYGSVVIFKATLYN